MKIKMFDRVLAAILALVVIAAGVLGVLIALDIIAAPYIGGMLDNLHATWQIQAIVIFCIAIILAIAIKVLFMGERKEPPAKDIMLKTTENGSIRISLFTIDSLAQKHVRSISYVRDLRSQIISYNDNSVRAKLWISFMPETNIPEISEQLQQSVKEYVQKYSGIFVQEVSVFIDDTSINLNTRAN